MMGAALSDCKIEWRPVTARLGDIMGLQLCHSRPPGTHLDMKKSTFKKLSKFLQVYTKGGPQGKGLLSLKEDKVSKEKVLVAVNRSHDLYCQYTPYKPDAAPEAANTLHKTEVDSSSVAAAEMPEFLVEELFKPSKELHPIFQALGLSSDNLFDAKEAGVINNCSSNSGGQWT